MKRSTVLFGSAAALVALGIGVLVAKRVPKLFSSTAMAAPRASNLAQASPQQQHFVLKFVKNPEPVPSFNLQSFSGQNAQSRRMARESVDPELLGYLVRAVPV